MLNEDTVGVMEKLCRKLTGRRRQKKSLVLAKKKDQRLREKIKLLAANRQTP